MSGKPGMMRRRHQDDVRAKIQTTQIVHRLEKHVFGDIELSASQVTAALGLLKKTTPDLSSTELTGNPNRPVNMSLEVIGVQPAKK